MNTTAGLTAFSTSFSLDNHVPKPICGIFAPVERVSSFPNDMLRDGRDETGHRRWVDVGDFWERLHQRGGVWGLYTSRTSESSRHLRDAFGCDRRDASARRSGLKEAGGSSVIPQ